MRIKKSDFSIKSHRTGCQLKGRENERVYEVFTSDGKKKVKGGFYRYNDADKWLSENVKIANLVLKNLNK